CQHYYRTPHSF
nr:immunoglobulin light chain junction region [Macaca mulatta]